MFAPQVYCTLIPHPWGSGTHGIGLTVVFSHGISPIKEKHCNTAMYGIVLYCIVNNLCDCVRETVRTWRGSAMVLLEAVSLYLSRL